MFDINYKEAIDFIKTLSEDDLEKLAMAYQITSLNSEDTVLALAEIASDDDLINMGFVLPKIEKPMSSECNSSYTYEEAYKLLYENKSSEQLYELCEKYDTFSLDDLAVAVTDTDLSKLDVPNQDEIEEEEEITTEKAEEYDNVISDILEDVSSDVKFTYLGKQEDNNYYFNFDSKLDFDAFKNDLDPELVESCDIVKEPGYARLITRKYKTSEDVIINDELNPLIFDAEHKMLPDVRDVLISYAEEFLNKLKDEKSIDIPMADLQIVGSNAGYLYTPTSDLDLHMITAEPLDTDIFELLKDEFDLYEAVNPLCLTDTCCVELGIEDGYNVTMDAKEARRYSLLDDIWVNDSDEFEQFTDKDYDLVSGYEEVVSDYVDKINDVIAADEYDDAVALKKEIRQNRSDDLANFGSMSMGNVVFKELRNNGAYGRLKEYIDLGR